jgi:hypothetical protein
MQARHRRAKGAGICLPLEAHRQLTTATPIQQIRTGPECGLA